MAYYIYLGDNNTTDFNVRANVHYRLAISILGDSEVVTRVSSYTLNVYDSYAENAIGGYCTYDVMGELFVEVEGAPAPEAKVDAITWARMLWKLCNLTLKSNGQ